MSFYFKEQEPKRQYHDSSGDALYSEFIPPSPKHSYFFPHLVTPRSNVQFYKPHRPANANSMSSPRLIKASPRTPVKESYNDDDLSNTFKLTSVNTKVETPPNPRKDEVPVLSYKQYTTPVQSLTQEEKLIGFETVFRNIRIHIIQKLADFEISQSSVVYIKNLLDKHVKADSFGIGYIVLDTLLLANDNRVSDEDIFAARVLGWAIVWLKAIFRAADKISYDDDSAAPVDITLMEHQLFEMLEYFLKDKLASYETCIKHIRKTSYMMSLGRISRENTKNLDAFTPVFFERITKNCSSYIRIVLPVILGLVLSGQTNLRILQEVERICNVIGDYYRVKDDYLDCYGDTEKTGKPGTDIENGKCNWLLVRALQLVTPQQRKILEESFGKSTDQVHAKRVKILYEVLDMKSKFDDFEARTLKDITEYSTEIDYYVNKEIFISLMNKIYKLGK